MQIEIDMVKDIAGCTKEEIQEIMAEITNLNTAMEDEEHQHDVQVQAFKQKVSFL